MNETARRKIERMRQTKQDLVTRRLNGEEVTNLEKWVVRVQEQETPEVDDMDRQVAYRDFLAARTAYNKTLFPLNDDQLMMIWRAWGERERRVVETQTFVGWLGSTQE